MRWWMALIALFCVSAAAMEPNLLSNGGLDRDADKDGVADGWFAEIHRQEGGEGIFNLDARTKRRGAFSQHIRHTSAKGWVRLSQDDIPAKPNARYLFRCWVKTDCRFLLIVYAFRPDGNYDTFVIAEGNGTQGNQWQLFSGVVWTPPDASRFKVSLVTDSQGEAWFDEAELVPLERPPYTLVTITNSAPTLDGDLSDPCWRDAEPLTPFLELGTGKVAEPATTAKVVATLTHLFVAFRCDEPNPQGMRLRTPESGEPAFTDDCVEVYLDPTHRHDGFWQFVVTAKGNRWAQQIAPSHWAQVWWLLPRPTQRLIADGWQAVTKIGSDLWTAEIAIPFSLLGIRPQTGSIIGINLCRSRKTGRGKGDEGREQNSAFAYLADQTFQRPERFPHAVFVGTGDRGLRTDERQFVASLQVTSLLTRLVPRPQRIVAHHKNSVVLQSPVRIVLPDDATPLERMAVTQLAQTLAQKGIAATITHRLPTNASAIVLATLDRLPASLSASLPLAKLRTFLARRGEEAYAMFFGTGTGGAGRRKGHQILFPSPVSRPASHPLPSLALPLVASSTASKPFGNSFTTGQGTSDKGRLFCHHGKFGTTLTCGCGVGTLSPPCVTSCPSLKSCWTGWLLMKFNTLVIEVGRPFPLRAPPRHRPPAGDDEGAMASLPRKGAATGL